MEINVRPGGAIVVPALTRQVANRMQMEAMVLKERRKIQEVKGGGRGEDPKGRKGRGDCSAPGANDGGTGAGGK